MRGSDRSAWPVTDALPSSLGAAPGMAADLPLARLCMMVADPLDGKLASDKQADRAERALLDRASRVHQEAINVETHRGRSAGEDAAERGRRLWQEAARTPEAGAHP